MKNVKICVEDVCYSDGMMTLFANGTIHAGDVDFDFQCTKDALTERLDMDCKGFHIIYDLLRGANVSVHVDSEYRDDTTGENIHRAKKFARKMFIAVNDKMRKVFNNTFEGKIQFLAYVRDISRGELNFGHDEKYNKIDSRGHIHGTVAIDDFATLKFEYYDGKLLSLVFDDIEYCPDIRSTHMEPECAAYISKEIEDLISSYEE